MLVSFDKRELPMGARMVHMQGHMFTITHNGIVVVAYADNPDAVMMWFDTGNGKDQNSLAKVKALIQWGVPFSVHR